MSNLTFGEAPLWSVSAIIGKVHLDALDVGDVAFPAVMRLTESTDSPMALTLRRSKSPCRATVPSSVVQTGVSMSSIWVGDGVQLVVVLMW
jgi:hypothetical protein